MKPAHPCSCRFCSYPSRSYPTATLSPEMRLRENRLRALRRNSLSDAFMELALREIEAAAEARARKEAES